MPANGLEPYVVLMNPAKNQPTAGVPATRLGAFTGALVALFAAAVLSMAWGMQLDAILRTHPPLERYAGAAAVVTGQQTAGNHGDVLLGERARVSSALIARLAAVPGVRAAIGDVSVPALLGGRAVAVHGWSSAALTPYVLSAGRPPSMIATVVAIYSRDLALGDALLAPELAAGHQTAPLLNEILIRTGQPAAVVAGCLQALAQRYPGLHVRDSASLITANDANDELNNWLGPFFVAMIFGFTSIAVLNTLIMIALRRRRELALLRLTGATKRQVRSMARWEAILIITIGLGTGLAIAATALLPLSHALTGGLQPYVPAGWLAAILGVSALLALVALSVPTRRALRTRPVEAIGIRE
jgi:FtsX-like permease family